MENNSFIKHMEKEEENVCVREEKLRAIKKETQKSEVKGTLAKGVMGGE